MRGDAGEHFDIVVIEAGALVERIDLDDPQHGAIAGHQRRAHHRANAKIGNALAEFETRVAGGIGREDRLLEFHDFVDDGAADAGAFVFAFAALLVGLGHEAAFGAKHDDEAAIGLRENVEETIEHLG